MALQPNTRVWRYMSFAKLVSMLQKKQLWLANVELLDDEWEAVPDYLQLNATINHLKAVYKDQPKSLSVETIMDMLEKDIKAIRKKTFVNCWTASEYESHALWRIYCPTPEGIAIQTTFDRLKNSISLPILEVTYDPIETDGSTQDLSKSITHKRPMFAYEQEVRIVFVHSDNNINQANFRTNSVGIDWDPELHLENIWVHPDAPFWFMETVKETVRLLAPKFITGNGIPRVWSSKMNSSPPF